MHAVTKESFGQLQFNRKYLVGGVFSKNFYNTKNEQQIWSFVLNKLLYNSAKMLHNSDALFAFQLFFFTRVFL